MVSKRPDCSIPAPNACAAYCGAQMKMDIFAVMNNSESFDASTLDALFGDARPLQ